MEEMNNVGFLSRKGGKYDFFGGLAENYFLYLGLYGNFINDRLIED